jgi:16S rRNA (cytosine967-C5)-methyltransferase
LAVTTARRVALEVLGRTGRGGRLDIAFDAAVRPLPPQDRRWLHELVYGVSRLRGRLDHRLARHLRRPIDEMPPALADLLRLGAYQILHMRSVPPYAAVSQTVDQARELGGRGAASLANAVLRKLSNEGESPAHFPDPRSDPAGYLSTWGSHPRWLVERWLARWPWEEVAALVDANNRQPPLSVVPLDGARGEALARLSAAGIQAREAGRGSGALEVTDDAGPSAALAALGAAVVQDPGAALVVAYADAPEGSRIADLCAAPGGKTLGLGRHARWVVAADSSLPRLRLVRENLVRTGSRAHLVLARAEAPPLLEADLVLLDVPCSGTGTLRRHPDARWRLGPDDIGRMARLQARLLRGAARVVPSGGLLVYSTCTLEPEENQDQVGGFLAAHPDFRLEATGAVAAELLSGGCLEVLPQRTGFDGAFAARMRRVAGP